MRRGGTSRFGVYGNLSRNENIASSYRGSLVPGGLPKSHVAGALEGRGGQVVSVASKESHSALL